MKPKEDEYRTPGNSEGGATMTSVSAVMTPNPAACRINTPVRDVARMMLDND
jgi:CBS domain-containing protein